MKYLTEEHKRKLSESKKGMLNPFYGKRHSESTKRKMSESRRGRRIGGVTKHSIKTKRKMSISQKGRVHSETTKEKISKSCKGSKNPMYGKHLSESTKRKMSIKTKGIPKSKAMCKKISKAQIKLWQNPIHKKKQIKAMCDGISKANPTEPERRLRNGLNKMFPGEYKFVGDGSVIIGNKKPDFINVNGRKKIIELFGDYWHSRVVTGKTKRQEENQRIKHFAKYGFQTLIVWQRELENISILRRKLKVFNEI